MICEAELFNSYPAVYIICVFPNTLARWLSFSDANPPPYQFTLFANAIYGLSGLFNLILFFFTRPKIVVGSVVPKSAILTHHRRESTWNSLQKMGRPSEYDYGILATDLDKPGRTDSSFEPKSPSRTINRPRASYELPSINSPPSSPTRNTHNRGNSSVTSIREVEEVPDIGWR